MEDKVTRNRVSSFGGPTSPKYKTYRNKPLPKVPTRTLPPMSPKSFSNSHKAKDKTQSAPSPLLNRPTRSVSDGAALVKAHSSGILGNPRRAVSRPTSPITNGSRYT